jgi:hypothetical protein
MKHEQDIFYNLHGVPLERRIQLMERARSSAYELWVDKLDCRESWCRQLTGMSFEDVMKKFDMSCHTVAIHRRAHRPADVYGEIGFCTMGAEPNYYLFMYVTSQSLIEIVNGFRLHPILDYTGTLRFYREAGAWYVYLPEWTGEKSDLQMVCGADDMLDSYSRNGADVFVYASTKPFDGSSALARQFDGVQDMGSGAWYSQSDPEQAVWLCDVAKFVFGDFPKEIHFKVLNTKKQRKKTTRK